MGPEQQRRQHQVVGRARSEHAPPRRQHPPGQRAVVGPEGPRRAVVEIVKGWSAISQALEFISRINGREVVINVGVSRHDEMVAVVDGHVENGIVVRSAPPAGLHRPFDECDRYALLGQANRGCEAGEPGSDHIGAADRLAPRHRARPRLSMIQASVSLSSLTRVRGAAQPSRSIRRKIWP